MGNFKGQVYGGDWESYEGMLDKAIENAYENGSLGWGENINPEWRAENLHLEDLND